MRKDTRLSKFDKKYDEGFLLDTQPLAKHIEFGIWQVVLLWRYMMKNIEVLEAYTKYWFVVSQRSKFKLVGYLDFDYVGCKVERNSTSGTCQLLERSLVSWSSN